MLTTTADDLVNRRRPGGSSGGGSGGSTGGGSTGGSSTGGGSTTGGNSRPIAQQHTYPPSNGWSGTSYSPPQQITHGSVSYPVSQIPPSTYVYQMRDSGSRYSNLVTGLMLWNSGRLSSSSHVNRVYQSTPGEVCTFRLVENSTMEDRRIDCKAISSFIWEWESLNGTTGNDSVIVETIGANSTDTEGLMDALEDKGDMILASPEMSCFVIRTLGSSSWVWPVDCALLQTYTASSWRNGAERLAPALVIILFQILLFKIL